MRRMTNDECRNSKRARESFILASGFLRHSTFVLRHLLSGCAHSSSSWRIADFFAVIFLPMKTKSVRCVSNGSKSQRPATKLKSCAPLGKSTKPFARCTLAGRLSAKRSKQSREKVFSELNVNDANSG